MRLAVGTAILALGLAAVPPDSQAQSPADRLPREPTVAEPAREVSPPDPTAPVEPLAEPVPDGGPSFVLRGVELEGATAVPEEELRPLWGALVGQPVTLATLQSLADRIGADYRARGYMLSQAVLPAQEIDDGVVRIRVIEGFVDSVGITGGSPNQRVRAEELFSPVPAARPLRLSVLDRSILLARCLSRRRPRSRPPISGCSSNRKDRRGS